MYSIPDIKFPSICQKSRCKMHANMAFLNWTQKVAKTLTKLGLVFVKKKEGNKITFLIFCLQCSRKIRIFVTGNEIENIYEVYWFLLMHTNCSAKVNFRPQSTLMRLVITILGNVFLLIIAFRFGSYAILIDINCICSTLWYCFFDSVF